MPNRFARGRKAFGFCSVCGYRCDLAKLRPQILKQKTTNSLRCPECLDADHPQLMLGMFPIDDPQALRDPRPDPSLAESREIVDNGKSISDLFIPPLPKVYIDYLTTESGDFLLTESGDTIVSGEFVG